MANKKVSEGVGKKIVEALKKQSEIEITPVSAARSQDDLEALSDEFSHAFDNEAEESAFEETSFIEESQDDENYLDSISIEETHSFADETPVEEKFVQPMPQSFVNYQQPASPAHDSFISELDNFEIPSNIAVLKKLIAQLPSGVTRHTGAQIIKQTMEALGISMKSVLQEAQQVQEGLNNSAKECQSSIQEYKKQITMLEKQAQNHHKQYSALNELISLFIQTGV